MKFTEKKGIFEKGNVDQVEFALKKHDRGIELVKWTLGASGLGLFLLVSKIEHWPKSESLIFFLSGGSFVVSGFLGFTAILQSEFTRQYILSKKSPIIKSLNVPKKISDRGSIDYFLALIASACGYVFLGILIVLYFAFSEAS